MYKANAEQRGVAQSGDNSLIFTAEYIHVYNTLSAVGEKSDWDSCTFWKQWEIVVLLVS